MAIDVSSPLPVTGPEGDGLPACLSNGVIGLRIRAISLEAGVAMLNGLAAVHRGLGVEYSPAAPFALAGDLAIDGVHLFGALDRARLVALRYDFAVGELLTEFTVDLGRSVLHVTVVTFASRSHASLVLQEAAVRAERLPAAGHSVRVDGRCTRRSVVTHGPRGGGLGEGPGRRMRTLRRTRSVLHDPRGVLRRLARRQRP